MAFNSLFRLTKQSVRRGGYRRKVSNTRSTMYFTKTNRPGRSPWRIGLNICGKAVTEAKFKQGTRVDLSVNPKTRLLWISPTRSLDGWQLAKTGPESRSKTLRISMTLPGGHDFNCEATCESDHKRFEIDYISASPEAGVMFRVPDGVVLKDEPTQKQLMAAKITGVETGW